MEIKRGYITPHFVTNLEFSTVEYAKCRILVSDYLFFESFKIVQLLELINIIKTPLLIIVDRILCEALSTLIVNKLRGIVQLIKKINLFIRELPLYIIIQK